MARISKKALSNFHGGEEIKDTNLLKWFGYLVDSVPYVMTGTVSINPPNVLANTTGIATATVAGVLAAENYIVEVNKPTHSAGLGVVNARVSADNTIELTFGNFTASAIDAAAETYTYKITQV